MLKRKAPGIVRVEETKQREPESEATRWAAGSLGCGCVGALALAACGFVVRPEEGPEGLAWVCGFHPSCDLSPLFSLGGPTAWVLDIWLHLRF